MNQFVKQINNANEEKINQEIQKQKENGYKVVSVACSPNNYCFFTALILFEKIEQ